MNIRLVCLFYLLSLCFQAAAAEDSSGDVLKCGFYEAFGKIICQSSSECSLAINPGKLSEKLIFLEQKDFSVSYFTDQYVKMYLTITKEAAESKAKISSAPIKQVRSVKTSVLNFKRGVSCL